MGIPKLYSDLYPYSEQVILGHRSEIELPSLPSVTKLVIDGPSLIYHAYNKVLAAKVSSGSSLPSSSRSLVEALPTYAEINQALSYLLNSFARNGVDLIGIFFDGALPLSKRSTRAERLEKSRAQLENYHLIHSNLAIKAQPHSAHDGSGLDLEKALWTHHPLSKRLASLPPPAFMVASAIEALMNSSWRHLTYVVPSEADVICAFAARSSGAAVLSNDSDLCLYDLGDTGCLAILNSLEQSNETSLTIPELRIQVLRPKEIAAKMNISSLINFAFERYQDVYASFATLKKSAQKFSIEGDPAWEEAYAIFRAEYDCSKQADVRLDKEPLRGIDPRLAELVVQMQNSRCSGEAHYGSSGAVDPFHVYFPVILENPSKDAAWNYGVEIRRTTYSFLALLTLPDMPSGLPSVLEFSRKGNRITTTKVQCLSTEELLVACGSLVEALGQFVQPGRSQSNEDGADSVSVPVSASAAASKSPSKQHSNVPTWHAFALHCVLRQRALDHRSDVAFEIIRDVFSVSSTKTHSSRVSIPDHPTQPTTTWSHMHLHATMQAVLYSCRMLKQVMDCALYRHEQGVITSTVLRPSSVEPFVTDLSRILDQLPEIAELFIPVQDLVLLSMKHGFNSTNHKSSNDSNITLLRSIDEIVKPVIDEFYPELSFSTPLKPKRTRALPLNDKDEATDSEAQTQTKTKEQKASEHMKDSIRGSSRVMTSNDMILQENGWIKAKIPSSTKRRQSKLGSVAVPHPGRGTAGSTVQEAILDSGDAEKETSRNKARKKKKNAKAETKQGTSSGFDAGNVFAVLSED